MRWRLFPWPHPPNKPNTFTTETAGTRDESKENDLENISDTRVYADGSGANGNAGAAAVLYKGERIMSTCYTLSRSRDTPSSVTVLWTVGLRRVQPSILFVIMIILFTHPSPNSIPPPRFHVSNLRFVSCFHSYSHFPFCSIFDPRA